MLVLKSNCSHWLCLDFRISQPTSFSGSMISWIVQVLVLFLDTGFELVANSSFTRVSWKNNILHTTSLGLGLFGLYGAPGPCHAPHSQRCDHFLWGTEQTGMRSHKWIFKKVFNLPQNKKTKKFTKYVTKFQAHKRGVSNYHNNNLTINLNKSISKLI